jgi:hypothetical protein
MSYVAASNNIENVIFNLRLKGLQPVLAHPERYNYYLGNIEQFPTFYRPWMLPADKHIITAWVLWRGF